MLRAGGYFAWAAQPVYKHEAALEEQWTGNNPFILCGYGESFFFSFATLIQPIWSALLISRFGLQRC